MPMMIWLFKSQKGNALTIYYLRKLNMHFLTPPQTILDCKKLNLYSQNLASITPPKTDSEIECACHIQVNTSFVLTNEKNIYFSQNYVVKTISILCLFSILNIANPFILVCDSNFSEGLLNHVTL